MAKNHPYLTDEEMQQYRDEMKNYAISIGVNAAVYEHIINVIVREDNDILGHRTPKGWIDRSLWMYQPQTIFEIK